MRFDKLPLLDDDFDAAQLLNAVANRRRDRVARGSPPDDPTRTFLDPEIAKQVYEAEWDQDPFTAGAVVPDPDFAELLEGAKAQIIEAMPEWREVLSLPVRVMVVPTSTYFGYSILSSPQHIYLASLDDQRRDPRLLLENYLHEFAHLWLYLIEEVHPFEEALHRLTYTLPSGTSGRTVTATMDAAYVAAVLRRYYARVDNVPRRSELTAYVAGCLMQIKDDPDLTEVGLSVCRRLASELTVHFHSSRMAGQ
ncbi:hypothetical protein JQ609_26485 [Bradyrhizobium sp. AUGA SZCCT0169]|uniref:aKG-HExxH-type peptide beta-hydroxylase n=1 Tax=Bradyrhizobium sp. AUGA SZCCT0169 TaxID=2807663 RepID=UPI001BAE2B90|nr:HEXXH motif-containing putative peptide modification protein [Bradyrhizobium sp. AUGA SZCCT0169]MBR1250455.1 hypothetical protein [Bradyrhizobium sp. AUGA SZCCT0169]